MIYKLPMTVLLQHIGVPSTRNIQVQNTLMAFVIAAIFSMSSCSSDSVKQDEQLVARVYDSHLYLSDMAGVVPAGMFAADSMLIISRYIDNWIRQQVLLHHALENLSPEMMNFDKKIENYRNSLIVSAFESALVNQHLDTLFTEEQLSEYYELHMNSFRLRESIVRVIYVKVPSDAPEIWRLRRLYRSVDPDELSLLEEYSLQNAASYDLEMDSWLFFRDLLREIPIKTNDPEAFLRANKYVEVSDEFYRYFLHIVEYKLKGDVSPLSLERDNIRNILQNQRRHSLINEKRNLYLQQARSEGKLQTFY